MGMFQRRKILNLNEDKSASFTRNFKDCGKTFSSQLTLSRHQTALNHQKRDIQQKEKLKKAKKTKNLTIVADVMRQVSSKIHHDADNETDEPCASNDSAIEQGRKRFGGFSVIIAIAGITLAALVLMIRPMQI